MVLGLTEDRPDVESAIHRVIDRGWFVLGVEAGAFETELDAPVDEVAPAIRRFQALAASGATRR